MSVHATILIVDDTPASLEVLEDLLLPLGYQVVSASNGQDALALAQQHLPDLILMDVMMPGISGYDVCQSIRNLPDLAEIPIILITALSDPASRIKGIEAGADDFITKPFNRHELRVRVNTITQLNRYRRLIIERQKFEYVINHASTGYLIINQQDQILFANLQAKRYFNLLIDTDDPLEDSFFQEKISQLYRLFPLSAWEDWPHQTDVPRYLVRPEDEVLRGQWLQAVVMPFESGQELNWIVTIHDVTQQISDQHDMRTFHAVIQHKLATPLVGLMSGLDILDRWSPQLTTEQTSELIQVAIKSAHRLNDQIRDVLQYVRTPFLLNGEEGFLLSKFPTLVEQLAGDFKVQASYVIQPEFVSDCSLALPDKGIETILYELFDNARKFHPDYEPIIEVQVTNLDDAVLLRVSDNGRCIPPELLDNVWTPYYQIEKSFTGEIPGIGLGLSTVSSLVLQVNGQCRIYNRINQPGVTVEIRLPIVSDNHQNDPVASAQVKTPTD